MVGYEIHCLNEYYKIENLVQKSQGFVKILNGNKYSNITITIVNDEKPKVKRILKVQLKRTSKVHLLENSPLDS